jgi:hypothetical protein
MVFSCLFILNYFLFNCIIFLVHNNKGGIFISIQIKPIKVVDSIMGSGKTSAAINLMNSDTENNYIFITPYLPEVERVKTSCKDRKFYDPKIYSKDGKLVRKFQSLHDLLANNKNIVSTHALFRRSNEETKELIHAGNYILILDEVMDVVEQLDLKKNDLDILINQDLIYIKDNIIYWNEEKEDFDTRYNDIRDMALNHSLVFYKNTVLLWTFPVDVFKAFKEVYILTYMFEGQIQKYYYDFYNIEYDLFTITNDSEKGYTITPQTEDNSSIVKSIKEELKSKINIYDGLLNNIGDPDFSLSSSWYEKKSSPTLKKLKNNILNYFQNIQKSKSNFNMWTTFDKHKSKLAGQGYTKGFIPCNARATNEYKHKNTIAYTVNRYVNPIIYGFFSEKDISINQNLFALSEMVQWIWRSAIREGNEINIYIPSKRMRNLLIKWLDGEIN